MKMQKYAAFILDLLFSTCAAAFVKFGEFIITPFPFKELQPLGIFFVRSCCRR